MKTPLVAFTWLALGCACALALHEKNAGPAKVELKFRPPAPAPLTPEQQLATFKVEKGWRVELVACEPMVQSPVAAAFDERGRLFVVEMRGYMQDLKGGGEKDPNGRISVLEDTDGDGKMDKATVFADGLVMPRAVMPVAGGALVAAPPYLWHMKDTDGDGRADTKTVVADDYGKEGGQPEHMANAPTWALDNHVYSSGYASRFRFTGGQWKKLTGGLGRGQWGLCQDDVGRLYFNYNSDLLRTDLLQTEAYSRNPLLRTAAGINHKAMVAQDVFPSHPTPGVNRGYDGKTLREDGTLTKATATCGAGVYRGDGLGAAFSGSVLIPEPAGNLVKRLTLSEKDGVVTAADPHPGKEFLTSTDERFRPVQSLNAPDGTMLIVDLYRGIIQHEAFLTHYLVANIEDRKLVTPFDRGRIWRVVRDGASRPAAFRMPSDAAGLVEALTHANGWVRDTAQRLIVERSATEAAPALRALATKADAPALARLHALWTLEGLASFDAATARAALKDPDARVRAGAVRAAPAEVMAEIAGLSADKDAGVLAQVAVRLSASNLPVTDDALAWTLLRRGDNVLVREGALTGIRGREPSIARIIADKSGAKPPKAALEALRSLASMVAQAGKADPFEAMLMLADEKPAVRLALAQGLAQTAAGKGAQKPKPLWLDGASVALASLKSSLKSGDGAKALAAIDARLVWVGKPGAPPPPKIAPLNAAQQAAFEKGRTIYGSLCGGCHQPHGYGLEGLAPPLVDSEWVLGSPDVTARIIMHGLNGPVKVGGRTWDLAMPPMLQLSDDDVAAVLTYVRREWEHTASPVAPAFVKDVRAKFSDRTAGWTAEELKPRARK